MFFNYHQFRIFTFVEIKDIEEFRGKDRLLCDLKKDSLMSAVSLLLRQGVEMLVNLRILRNAVSNPATVEELCHLLVLNSEAIDNEHRLENSKNFYKCTPRHYQDLSNSWKNEFEKLRSQLGQNGLFLLSKFEKKLKKVFQMSNVYERTLLGFDPYTLFSFTSRKIHVSTSNVIMASGPYKMYLDWSLLFIFELSVSILELIDDSEEARIGEIRKTLNERSKAKLSAPYHKNDYILCDFGIGVVTDVQERVRGNHTVIFEYLFSNEYKTGEADEIPRIFTRKKIEKTKFQKIVNKYRKGRKDVATDSELNEYLNSSGLYSKFWYEFDSE